MTFEICAHCRQAGSSGDLAQSFGAMFTFRNQVYAAADDGDGVYRINLDGFDFDSPSTPVAVFEYVGRSVSTSGNDGLNCLRVADPYEPPKCPDLSNRSPELPLSSFNASDCKCDMGYTGPDGRPCVACEPGKYKNTTGSAACITCPPARTSYPVRGGTRCVCVTPRPFFICDCLEVKWRENR